MHGKSHGVLNIAQTHIDTMMRYLKQISIGVEIPNHNTQLDIFQSVIFCLNGNIVGSYLWRSAYFSHIIIDCSTAISRNILKTYEEKRKNEYINITTYVIPKSLKRDWDEHFDNNLKLY